MSRIEIVEERDEYRLVRRGDRYAVVECRGDKVLSCHCPERREAHDTGQGMAKVIGDEGWMDEDAARRGFRAIVDEEVHWAEVLW